jgi:ATPase subunit of ABC transporter with duplicated ATPase domains
MLHELSLLDNLSRRKVTLIRLLDLHTVIGKSLDELSKGYRQRVGLAQAIMHDPDILILDEPTNHINFRHLPIIADALDKYDGAMILVSHVPEFVKKIRIDETLELA